MMTLFSFSKPHTLLHLFFCGERWTPATLPNELLAHSPYSITPKDLKREILAEREEIHI
jgi:hypothetical protein